MTTHETDDESAPVHKRTLRFVYHHSVPLVAVSVAWFVTSLPIITAGPATLGAYATIRSLREKGQVDREYIKRALRTNGLHAALLSFLPMAFIGAGSLYLGGAVTAGGFGPIIAVVALYIGGYVAVALIPTFVALADGTPPVAALRQAYVWTATDPASTMALALVTVGVVGVTALSTIGFVLLFPALAFSYHVERLADELDGENISETPVPTSESPV